MNDDAALLRRYVDQGSEPAFAELVQRYVDLVYSAALRRTSGDPHRAAEVAQRVFTSLAREARKLSRHPLLGAWLHTATRNAALNLVISDQRRKIREAEALAAAAADATADDATPDWDKIRPVLDAAIDELPELDRAAVVLRFLERRPFAEMGRALRVSEDAARMRTDRALEKLRTGLARRGITSTAAALGVVVSGQALVAAPIGLAALLTGQSLSLVGAGAGTALATFFMSIKIISAAGALAFAAFVSGVYFGGARGAETPPLSPAPDSERQSQVIASLQKSALGMRQEIDALKADAIRLTTENARLSAARRAPPPLAAVSNGEVPVSRGAQQKAILNNLRQLAAAADQFKLENGRWPASLDEIVGEKKYVRRLIPVDGENYAGVSLVGSQAMSVTTANGVGVIFDPTGNSTTRPERTPAQVRAEELGARIEPAGRRALEAYRAAHNGHGPKDSELDGLIPYFATAQEGADFVEFLEARKAMAQ